MPRGGLCRTDNSTPGFSTSKARGGRIASSSAFSQDEVLVIMKRAVERDARLRGLRLQNSECVKCLRWATSAWLYKFTIVYRLAIPGPLPHGRGSEGPANKTFPGQTDDRMILRERAFQIRELWQPSTRR